MTRRELVRLLASAAVGPSVAACAADGPPVLAFDRDACDWCRMTLVDRRSGGAARTASGRIVRFDAIECLAAWVGEAASPPEGIWLVDAAAPGRLRPLEAMRIHREVGRRGMMGQGYRAVARSAPPGAASGPPITWTEVRAAVAADPSSAGAVR